MDLAFIDTLGISFELAQSSDYQASTYFENYSNPLNFSVMLSLASVFALLYAALNFTQQSGGILRIFNLVKTAMEYWPLVVSMGLALEIQQMYGFHFPGILAPPSNDSSILENLTKLLPSASSGLIPEANLAPALLTVALYLTVLKVGLVVQEGRVPHKGEIELTITFYEHQIERFKSNISQLLNGEVANLTLNTAREYLQSDYGTWVPQKTQCAEVKTILGTALALVSFLCYFIGLTRMMIPRSQEDLNSAIFFLTLCAVVYLGCHSVTKAREVRQLLAFRKVGTPFGAILFSLLQTIFFLFVTLLAALLVINLLGTNEIIGPNEQLSVGATLVFTVHFGLIVAVAVAFIAPAKEHAIGGKRIARFYLETIDSNLKFLSFNSEQLAAALALQPKSRFAPIPEPSKSPYVATKASKKSTLGKWLWTKYQRRQGGTS